MYTKSSVSQHEYRLIVIGSGISGLFIALEARRLGPVLVLTKGSIDDCNTKWAQGGIAAAVGAHDSVEAHLRDTIAAGAGLVDEAAAGFLCREAPARVRDLVTYGVAFDEIDGMVALGREAAHSQSRVLHAGGDRTGAAIETALAGSTRAHGVTVLDYTLATRIVVEGGEATGVEAIDLKTGTMETYTASAIVVASGGAGQLYSHTTNPEVATGDGIALAYEAGAEVADLEFYQFHPTALRVAGAPPFLISEAVRGEGAVLRNASGKTFMSRYHELRDLAPRDVVARAIVNEMRNDGADHVVLDCRELREIDLAVRFPGIFAFCQSVGIDIREQPIPDSPAAHYLMGGIRTDSWGRTTIPGLYACGECACTGVHGANRLASNSLMETIVFGKRVVEHLTSGAKGAAAPVKAPIRLPYVARAPGDRSELQWMMWKCAGIERSGDGLSEGLAAAGAWPAAVPADGREAREPNERTRMAALATVMLQAALIRTESRGAHFRRDYPATDDAQWKRHLVFRRAD